MSLQGIPASERVHIAFFGKRNAGKSSLVNAVTGQELSVVSEVLGTTTDPVKKTMELLPLGPVVIIDTPGFDDDGLLGQKRVAKTKEILVKTDIAVLVVDGSEGISSKDQAFVQYLTDNKVPYVIAYTKGDLLTGSFAVDKNEVVTSSVNGTGINELKECLAHLIQDSKQEKYILSDLFEAGDILVLVTPIDASAPKGRLILPQQLTLREILDFHGMVVTCQVEELSSTLDALVKPPKLVITDSQAFEAVAKIVPDSIPLTSFSLLFARYKGTLESLIQNVNALDRIKDCDKILISEGCTHHRQCEDIGTIKIPSWIKQYTHAQIEFDFSSGGDFPEDLSVYSLIVHCGGCMLQEKEMQNRVSRAQAAGVPMVNYGALIAKVNGIFSRAVAPLLDRH